MDDVYGSFLDHVGPIEPHYQNSFMIRTRGENLSH
jgi:hypothetical protein